MTTMCRKMPLWALVALVSLGTQSAQALLIDNFNAGLVDLTADAADTVERAEDTVAGVLGEERETTVFYDAAHSVAADDVSLRVNFDDSGNLSHSQDAGVTGLTYLSYDGDDDSSIGSSLDLGIDFTGLGELDLTAGGLSDSFIVTVLFADHTVTEAFGIRVYSDETHFSDLFRGFVETITTPSQVFFAYADFVPGEGAAGAADFTNIGAIVLQIDGRMEQALDLRLDQFETNVIPEPTTLGLFALGAGMLGLLKRRRPIQQG